MDDRERAYKKAWHERNREKHLAQMKARSAAKRAEIAAYNKSYRLANKEVLAAKSKVRRQQPAVLANDKSRNQAWREKNYVRKQRTDAEYRAANRERLREYHKVHRAANLEQIRQKSRERRASLTTEEKRARHANQYAKPGVSAAAVARAAKWRKANPERHRELQGDYRRRHYLERSLTHRDRIQDWSTFFDGFASDAERCIAAHVLMFFADVDTVAMHVYKDPSFDYNYIAEHFDIN